MEYQVSDFQELIQFLNRNEAVMKSQQIKDQCRGIHCRHGFSVFEDFLLQAKELGIIAIGDANESGDMEVVLEASYRKESTSVTSSITEDETPPQLSKNPDSSIQFVFSWLHPAQTVVVKGSWDDWVEELPLEWNGKYFEATKSFGKGYQEYKFIVDGWCVNHDPISLVGDNNCFDL
ncbi:hypothetical protein HDV02_005410 [Globomyces sp. JEL0801]|nr:hypothetical protein HDV02_005410 [Globomyces sp. JEL0801]